MTDQQIEIIIKARDEASAALAKIDDALKGTTKNLQDSQQGAEGFSLSFTSLAAAVGLGNVAADAAQAAFGALAGFMKESMAAAAEAERGQAQLTAVLQSTGGAAGVTASMANELATKFANLTTFTDDEVLATENMMLTFTNVSKDVFPTAIQATLDMSTALGTDLKGSAIQLGKALNDPIEGINALTRVGVKFDEQTKKQIKTLVEQGKVMEAQNIILSELNVEFGGSAALAAQTYEGRMKKLNNTIGEVQENIGKALIPSITSITESFQESAESSQAATETTTVYKGRLDELEAIYQVNKKTTKDLETLKKQYTAAVAAETEQVRKAAAGATNFQTALYSVVQGGKTAFAVLIALGNSLLGVGAAMVGAAKVGAGFVQDVFGIYSQIWESTKQLVSGVGKALLNLFSGKPGEALESLKSAFNISPPKIDFSNTSAAFASASALVDKFAKHATDSWKQVGSTFMEGVNRDKFQPVLAAVNGMGGEVKPPGGGGGGDSNKKAKEALKELEEKLKQMFFDLGKIGDVIKEQIEEAKKKTEEWRAITKDLEDGYAEVSLKLKDAGIEVEGITDQSKDLQRTHAETLKDMMADMKRYADEAVSASKSVAKITDEIEKLKDQQGKAIASNQADTNRNVAAQIAELEQKKAENEKLLKQSGMMTADTTSVTNVDGSQGTLNLGTYTQHDTLSEDRRKEVIKEIAEQQALLAKHKQFVIDNETEISRARNLIGMDDISRTLALASEKEAQIKKDYDDKIAALESEKKLDQAKYDNAIAALKDSNEKIKAERAAAEKDYAKYLIANASLSTSYIQTEINKYNQLADAISNSAKGIKTKFTPEESALLTAYKNNQAPTGATAASTAPTATAPTVASTLPTGAAPSASQGSTGGVTSPQMVSILQNAVVNLNNGQDVQTLANTIANELARAVQNQRLGLASQH